MVKCYYCKLEMLEENLGAHCNLKHKAAKRIAGEASVSGYFATVTKKSKHEESSSSSTPAEMLLASGGRKTPEDIILTRPETPVEDVIEDEGDKEYLDSEALKKLLQTLKNIDLKSDDSLNEIKLLRDNINSLSSKLEMKIPEFAKPDDVQPIDDRIVNLRDCKTIGYILETFF